MLENKFFYASEEFQKLAKRAEENNKARKPKQKFMVCGDKEKDLSR